MVFQLNTKNIYFNYARNRKLLMLVVGYYGVSLSLYVFANVDVLPPCLFKSFFGIPCFGCGLTKAVIQLLYFDFSGAYHSNSLVFIVLPLLVYIGYKDFNKVNQKIISD